MKPALSRGTAGQATREFQGLPAVKSIPRLYRARRCTGERFHVCACLGPGETVGRAVGELAFGFDFEQIDVDLGWRCGDTWVVPTDIDDEEVIRQVVERLEEKFPDVLRAEIEDVARAELSALSGRPVRDFLTILTERAVKRRLRKSVHS